MTTEPRTGKEEKRRREKRGEGGLSSGSNLVTAASDKLDGVLSFEGVEGAHYCLLPARLGGALHLYQDGKSPPVSGAEGRAPCGPPRSMSARERLRACKQSVLEAS